MFNSGNRSRSVLPSSNFAPAESLTPLPPTQFSSGIGRRLRATDRGGNTLAAATAIGDRPIRDTVSKQDSDFFKLTLSGGSNDVRLNFQNRSSAVISGSLLDGQGRVLSYNGSKQTVNFQSSQQIRLLYEGIAPGTYYLRVQTKALGSNAYKVSLTGDVPFIPPLPPCGCGQG